ncbi:Uncharacterized protein SCF082_LOCUS29064 [Durusdinium trenchii]
MTSLFKQKVEERTQSLADADPPAKRPCSQYEKKIQKLPNGDLSLDILHFVMSFRKEDATDTVGHPAQLVVDMLGCDDDQSRKFHCGQLEAWYQEYAQHRGVLDQSMDDEIVKIPLVCLKFDKPDDGLPVMEDWCTTFESMLFSGIELNREPLDISAVPGGTCDFQSVEPVKGWTRASVIALILIAASELDHVDPATEDKLKPLAKVEFGLDAAARSFRNLVVSYRSAERQAPNCLQLALRFSRLMELAETEGRHLSSMTTEERLRAIIADFHESPGLSNKNFLDEDKSAAD